MVKEELESKNVAECTFVPRITRFSRERIVKSLIEL